jgi:molecular chaperone GrpE (heat shock protein)
MAGETASKEQSPAVALFQKAHQKMVTLQRLDEQIALIMEQRKRIQEELRDVQSQINGEFDRVMKAAAESPAKLLVGMVEGLPSATGNGRNERIGSASAGAAA